MSDIPDFIDQAAQVLKDNDHGLFTIPAHGLYPHQWLWDSCFIAIGLRHIDVERAKIEILSLCRAQWRNGMLPHIIFTPGKKQRMHSGVWDSWLSPFSPDDVSTSGISQPPIIAEAVVRVGEKMTLTDRRSWYREIWPHLIAYHQWLYTERDPHHEGLVLQIHPWETGLDDNPAWMSELDDHLLPWWIRGLQKTKLEFIVGRMRLDTRYVPSHQRPTNIEALALFSVQRRLRRKAYDINKILNHTLFAIEDLAYNCILIRANEHLKQIAKTLSTDIPEDLRKSIELSPKTLEELWDPFTEQYYPRDFVTHRLIKQPTIESLLPLYAGCISKERAALLVKTLENEHMFGPAFPVPSTPLNSPWFDPNRYWQGPSWVNMNWLIIDGLHRYGYANHAEALRESTLELVQKHGFFEYFNPINGNPLGAANFSWTAALSIDLAKTQKF